MYTDNYAPWEYYPKFLRPNEIHHPLNVLEEFFSGDRLDGHAEQLLHWRDLVIDNTAIVANSPSPSSLLFQYHLNLRLLEAMYLLYIQNSRSYRQNDFLVNKQLHRELKDWGLPCNVSQEEADNPYLILAKIFNRYSLPQYREIFENWLYTALSTKKVGDNIPPAEIIHVYENQILAYCAAWLIHKSPDASLETDQPEALILATNNGTEPPVIGDAIALSKSLRGISIDLSLAEKLGLDEVVNLIIQKVRCIKSITLLGLHRKPFTYYFVIIIDKDANVAEHVLSNKIEDICRSLISVIVLVRKADGAEKSMLSGSRFWNNTLSKGLVAYTAPEFVLPPFSEVATEIVNEKIKEDWQRWGIQGQGFLQGAEFYMGIADYPLAVFLMHQAAESTLIAIIKVLSGYRFSSHNLGKMLQLTLLYTDELQEAFGFEALDSSDIIRFLQNAYSDARYKDTFVADEQVVKSLLPKVEKLLATAKAIYESLIDRKSSTDGTAA